jgi:hypothetical protein
MATKIEIINNALLCLGQPPIESLSDPNQAIQGVVQLYDMLLNNCLVMHPWKFALKTAELVEAASTTEPITANYSKVYHLPGDYLYCWRMYPSNFDYRMQGRFIYTNMGPTLKMIYVYQASPGDFPDYFSLFISYQLAAASAQLVTENSDLTMLWEQKSKQQLLLAQNRDASQQPSDTIQYDPYWAAHAFGGY